MSYVVAGVLSGLLMASVFVAVGPIMVFHLATEPSPLFERIQARISPMAMMMGLVVLSYPVWTLIGAVAGVLFRMSAADESGGGPGSGNLVYTLVIVAAALAVGAPLAVLLRRVLVGVAALSVLFVGVFGWLLPILAE